MRAIGLPIVPSPWHSHRMTSAFWDRLTEAFADAGYETSQSGVARRMGVGQSAVAKWANGTGLPTLRKCIEIARITGVNTEWLVSGRAAKKNKGLLWTRRLSNCLSGSRTHPTTTAKKSWLL